MIGKIIDKLDADQLTFSLSLLVIGVICVLTVGAMTVVKLAELSRPGPAATATPTPEGPR